MRRLITVVNSPTDGGGHFVKNIPSSHCITIIMQTSIRPTKCVNVNVRVKIVQMIVDVKCEYMIV